MIGYAPRMAITNPSLHPLPQWRPAPVPSRSLSSSSTSGLGIPGATEAKLQEMAFTIPFGFIFGLAASLIIPQTRQTRGTSLYAMAFSAAIGITGALLPEIRPWGLADITRSMARMGGVFVGSSIASLLIPKQKEAVAWQDWSEAEHMRRSQGLDQSLP